jgi:hypothetical protein
MELIVATECLSEQMTALKAFFYQLVTVSLRLIAEVLGLGQHGAEVVAIRDFLGHSQIASSERYAKISSQKIKQEYMRTMQKILKQGQV